ncbi:MAG: disulfide bond formation protein B [Patescibacteria group bacterium]
MSDQALTVLNLLSFIAVIGNAAIVALAIVLIANQGAKKRFSKLSGYLGERGLLFALFIAVLGTIGSLYFSEIAHLPPCKLCWFQRIAMYPQVILLGIAIWKKHTFIALYGIVLSAVGAAIAVYHYYIQMVPTGLVPCSIYDPVSCTEKVAVNYGYVTFPMISLTGFLLMLLLLLFFRRYHRT